MRDSSLLSFKRSDLAQLTFTAQQTVDRRQHYLLFVTTYLPWFVVIGLLFGALLVTYGLVGWATRQRVADEREDQDLLRSKYEIRRLTDEEQYDRQEQEADEAIDPPRRSDLAVIYVGISDSGQDAANQVDGPRSADERMEFVEVIRKLEAQLAVKLTAALPSDQITTAVRVGDYTADALVVDEINRKGYIVDLKYSGSHIRNNLRNRLIESVSLASASIRLSEGYDFPFRPVLLLVVDDNASVPSRQAVAERLASIGTAFSVGILVIFSTVTAFDRLTPSELRRLLDARETGSGL